METQIEDLRVKVRFIKKEVIVENEKTKEKEDYVEYFKGPNKQIYKEGDEALVTRKHAIWLESHGFIEQLPKGKENKKASKRETK